MNLWLVMIGGGLLTFAIRLSFIIFLEKKEIPPIAQRALRLVPVAVFSALIFQLVFIPDGQVILSPLNPRLLSGLLAALVAYKTRNILLTLLVGMAALLLLQALL
jgi:branched-subunit amino acid transport protein